MPDFSHRAIDFDHFKNWASRRQVSLALRNWKPLSPEQVLVDVLSAVLDIFPALQENATYLTEDLCGPELWEGWKTGPHRAAGMCLRYLCETGALPLEVASPPGRYPLHFRLKTSS